MGKTNVTVCVSSEPGAVAKTGNHLLWTDQTKTNLYSHNTLNQIVREILQDSSSPTSACATNALTWAAAGGLQSDGRWVYDYDAEDRLKSVTAATLTNGAQRIVNRYDWRHRRIGKDVYSCELDASAPDGIRWELVRRHDFAYDDWNLIHETVTTAGPTPTVTETQYFWGPDLSNTLQGAGGVGGLLAVSRNGAFYFPVYDNNGNVVKYVDESGSVVASYVTQVMSMNIHAQRARGALWDGSRTIDEAQAEYFGSPNVTFNIWKEKKE